MTGSPLRGHVVLVGLPGAGKTTVGRVAAGLLGVPFLDFDEEIARREDATVAELFAARGEAGFRSLERRLTEELRSRPPMVLAPGGGWVTIPGVVALLRPPGRIIHLRIRPAAALARLGLLRESRPLLRAPDPETAMLHLYERRKPLYEAADAELDAELLPVQSLASMVSALATGGE